MFANPQLDAYVEAHCSPEHPYLHALYRATHQHLLHARMASGHLQGRLLQLLCQLHQPQTVVELGTYSGYATLAMASGMRKGSQIHTFEINDEQEDFTRPWLENSPWASVVDIHLHIGNVFERLPEMNLTIDLAFVDANKRDYQAYFDMLFPYLAMGGLLVADNTLWDGHVLNPQRRDPQTDSIRHFNTTMAQDPRLETVILPIRDGLSILRKVGE